MNINKCKGHAAVLGANVIFGLNVPVTKALPGEWVTPLGYMAARTLSALVIFWIIQCFTPKEKVSRKKASLFVHRSSNPDNTACIYKK